MTDEVNVPHRSIVLDAAARGLVLVLAARVLRVMHKSIADSFDLFDTSGVLLPFALFAVWCLMLIWTLGDFDLGARTALVTQLRRLSEQYGRWPEYLRSNIRSIFRFLPLIMVTAQISGILIDRSSKLYYGTDALLFSRYSVDLLLSGESPYEHSMAPAFERFPFDPSFQTGRMDGTAVNSLSYPALSVLFFVPQVLIGSDAIDVTVLLVLLVVAVGLTWMSPWPMRWMFPTILMLHSALVFYSGGGVFDILWVFPLIVSIISWSKAYFGRAGIFFGLACAVKQTPWLVAPFLLVWALREGGVRRGVRLVVASVGAFIAVNLPFIISDPVSWFYGVLTPLVGGSSLVAQGEGLVLLNQSGAVQWPKAVYTTTMMTVLALALLAYAVFLPKVRWLAWVAPVLPLWFAWRSLHNYFLFSLPIAFCILVLRARGRIVPSSPSRCWSPQVFLGGASVIATVSCVVVAVFSSQSSVSWSARLVAASDWDGSGRASEFLIEVNSDVPVDPVFSGVHSRFQTVMHWEREPDLPLEAGQKRTYRVRAPVLSLAPPDGADMLFWVRDRGKPEAALVKVQAVQVDHPKLPNAEFMAWRMTHRGVSLPWGWSLGWAPLTWPWTSSLSPAAEIQRGSEGIVFQLEPTSSWRAERQLSLEQHFSEPIGRVFARWHTARGGFIELVRGGETARFELEGAGARTLDAADVLSGPRLQRFEHGEGGIVRLGVSRENVRNPATLALLELEAR